MKRQRAARTLLIRILVVLTTVLLGAIDVFWRWLFSVNWDAWWIGVPLVIVETYSPIDCVLFGGDDVAEDVVLATGAAAGRTKDRGEPDPPLPGVSVDVFTTTYNEPIEMVITTAAAARRISYPDRRPLARR